MDAELGRLLPTVMVATLEVVWWMWPTSLLVLVFFWYDDLLKSLFGSFHMPSVATGNGSSHPNDQLTIQVQLCGPTYT